MTRNKRPSQNKYAHATKINVRNYQIIKVYRSCRITLPKEHYTPTTYTFLPRIMLPIKEAKSVKLQHLDG